MKKIFLVILSIGSLFFISCKKDAKCPFSDTSTVAPASEIDSVKKYLVAQSITAAVQYPSGLFYTITNAGTGANPELCSDVIVQYNGTYFNGTFLDGTTGAQQAKITLGQTIDGWRKGLPLLKAGGAITLYIPPTLGYVSSDYIRNGVVAVPANSFLKFTVTLVAVQ